MPQYVAGCQDGNIDDIKYSSQQNSSAYFTYGVERLINTFSVIMAANGFETPAGIHRHSMANNICGLVSVVPQGASSIC